MRDSQACTVLFIICRVFKQWYIKTTKEKEGNKVRSFLSNTGEISLRDSDTFPEIIRYICSSFRLWYLRCDTRNINRLEKIVFEYRFTFKMYSPKESEVDIGYIQILLLVEAFLPDFPWSIFQIFCQIPYDNHRNSIRDIQKTVRKNTIYRKIRIIKNCIYLLCRFHFRLRVLYWIKIK